jgi:methylenetetrahydrofolate reductase (NADPH)
MKIPKLFTEKKPVFSLEIFPPKRDGAIDTIYSTIEQLCEVNPDFISVTYGAGGNPADNSTCEIATNIKRRYGIEPLAHLTCVNSTADQVKEMIRRLTDNGIENVLALRGDINPNIEPRHDFAHANELAIAIQRQSDLQIVGACYPEGHYESKSINADIENLKYKIGAGVSLLITQLFFDNQVFYSFIERAREAGITVPVSAGIMPITNKRQVERIVALSGSSLPHELTRYIGLYEDEPDKMFDAGIDYAANQIIDLIRHGADGIHLYTMNNPRTAKCIYEKISKYL